MRLFIIITVVLFLCFLISDTNPRYTRNVFEKQSGEVIRKTKQNLKIKRLARKKKRSKTYKKKKKIIMISEFKKGEK